MEGAGMSELSDNVQQQLCEHILREKIDDLEAREEQYEARIAELETYIGQLINAGNELTMNPNVGNYEEREATWTKLWLEWKEREE